MCVRERGKERGRNRERGKGKFGFRVVDSFWFWPKNRMAGAWKDEQITARTRGWGLEGWGLFTFDLARRRAQDGAFPRDIEVGFDRHDCGRSVEVFGECWYE